MKDSAKSIDNNYFKQRVEFFGLFFHNQRVLLTFLFFSIGIIVCPVITFFLAKAHFNSQPDITISQSDMYAGLISVGVVVLFMIGYCIVAVSDEANFSYEQYQDSLLSEEERKRIAMDKIKEAYDMNVKENSVSGQAKKQQIKKEEKIIVEMQQNKQKKDNTYKSNQEIKNRKKK